MAANPHYSSDDPTPTYKEDSGARLANTLKEIEKRPDDIDLNLIAADLLIETQHYQEALKHFEAVLEQDALNLQALYGTAQLLQAYAQFEDAIALYEIIKSQEQANEWVHLYLGESYECSGNLSKAFMEYTQATLLKPGFTEACEKLAALTFQTGHYQLSLDFYHKLLVQCPGSLAYEQRIAEIQGVIQDIDQARHLV